MHLDKHPEVHLQSWMAKARLVLQESAKLPSKWLLHLNSHQRLRLFVLNLDCGKR